MKKFNWKSSLSTVTNGHVNIPQETGSVHIPSEICERAIEFMSEIEAARIKTAAQTPVILDTNTCVDMTERCNAISYHMPYENEVSYEACSLLDSGFIFAPYIPLQISPSFLEGKSDNNLSK